MFALDVADKSMDKYNRCINISNKRLLSFHCDKYKTDFSRQGHGLHSNGTKDLLSRLKKSKLGTFSLLFPNNSEKNY